MRDPKEVERSFRSHESELDSLLALAKADISSCAVEDHSNRTGFDAYYLWEQRIIDDIAYRSEIYRVSIILSYLEPWEEDEEKRLEITTRSEVFQQGKMSRVDHRATEQRKMEEVSRVGLGGIIKEKLKEGREVIPTWRADGR